MKKSIIAVLAAAIVTLSFLATAIYIPAKASPEGWYMTIPGVLDSDTYYLYPYAAKSLTIGISKFGEVIDGDTHTGLFYDTTDPFAPYDLGSPPENEWIEGWILNTTYVESGNYMNLWAMATYSDYKKDGLGIGGDWHENVTVGSTDLSVRGGRKTSGGAVSYPLTVLYDGPREFIALSKTTIFETPVHSMTNALFNVSITFDFNKVKKALVIFKDIKRIDKGKDIGDMQVEFGDRGEWDLGTTAAPPLSYAHVFRNSTTVYDDNYQPWYNTTTLSLDGTGKPYDGYYDVVQVIDQGNEYAGFAAFWPKPITTYVGSTQYDASRPFILTSTSTITQDYIGNGVTTDFTANKTGLSPTPYPQQNSSGIFWKESPMVFLDGSYMFINGSTPGRRVYYFDDNDTVKFPQAPAVNQNVRIVYKTAGWNLDDMSSSPESPFVIGEWCFTMNSTLQMFRGVTAYGITDLHDGVDVAPSMLSTLSQADGHVIDREVQYQLDEIFNPWDLNQAIEKDTTRWVEYTWNSTSWTSAHRPVIDSTGGEWDEYNDFTERVEDLNTSTLLHQRDDDPLMGDTSDYTFSVTDGYATITGLTASHEYKILYSTYNSLTNHTKVTFTNTWTNKTYSEINSAVNGLNPTWATTTFNDTLNVKHEIWVDQAVITLTNDTASSRNYNYTYDLTGHMCWNASDIKVFKENEASIKVYGQTSWEDTKTNAPNATVNVTIVFDTFRLFWNVTPPYLTDVHIDWADFHFDYDIALTHGYNNTGPYDYFNLTVTFTFGGDDGLYKEHIPGRYEWVVVGRNAATVDSAGASLVSAAFKNKQVEIGVDGEDMKALYAENDMRWVLSRVGQTDNSFDDYLYCPGTDYRTGLRDDFCTTWPVSSSNMIGVGGPYANKLSYYGNDFMSAIYGLGQFTSYPAWQERIDPVTCWAATNMNHTYSSYDNNTIGYGVISTYQDINGTNLLLIWGYFGRDTDALTNWFHQEGIYELQQAPCGVTSIVVKITYDVTDLEAGYKPKSISVVEVLGTISERLWKGTMAYPFGTTFVKGGIHDAPDDVAMSMPLNP